MIRAGLVDEIVVHTAPVLLGKADWRWTSESNWSPYTSAVLGRWPTCTTA
ncbi:hypothetical protein ORV05_13205 [Amycolatopsis cynarae]|uniref:Bacterial bifunctional deaminase-reductase C-terminal domain-containing protein n=1 Tax=Amycolatopsis cynarae TaxID=2995223 RepID=A0ABY7B8K4_9PSEU|nr:hypothetical protein [Amycolatopsis sp. HUAS 11-8]WAL68687.1 hypothetical protein ORV05_13205 [Amycolatopsis sp. HUAS 11-8]